MPVGYNYTIGDTVNLYVFKLKLKYRIVTSKLYQKYGGLACSSELTTDTRTLPDAVYTTIGILLL